MSQIGLVFSMTGDLLFEITRIGKKEGSVKADDIDVSTRSEPEGQCIVQPFVRAQGQRRHGGAHGFVQKDCQRKTDTHENTLVKMRCK